MILSLRNIEREIPSLLRSLAIIKLDRIHLLDLHPHFEIECIRELKSAADWSQLK